MDLNDIPGWKWPVPCISSAHFAAQFPRSLRGREHLVGHITGRVRARNIYKVKWDHLKTPVALHESFLVVEALP